MSRFTESLCCYPFLRDFSAGVAKKVRREAVFFALRCEGFGSGRGVGLLDLLDQQAGDRRQEEDQRLNHEGHEEHEG
ncbi:MAG TPA: hypothetical protein VGG02_07660 [Chthoniobacterales bacterium]|jgi:hypothetical protein